MYPKEERDYHKRKENNMIGFPECGNCESTPCQCERDDNDWFISSTDNKPMSHSLKNDNEVCSKN